MVSGDEVGTRRVMIWRDSWLAGSETFIRNQMVAMRRWTPVAVGLYRVDSPLSDPSDDVAAVTRPAGKIRARMLEGRVTRRVVDQAIRDHTPDLVHVHFLKDATRVVPAAHRRGVPVVVTVHGFDITSWPDAGQATPGARWILRRVRSRSLRRTFERTSAIVAVSHAIRDLLIAHGAPEDRIHVLPIGIPVEHAADVTDLTGREGVVFVGRLVAKKGVEDLLEAWASLPHELRTGGLTVVGDGPLRADLEHLADRLQVRVTFTGALAPEEVRHHMSRAAVFCAPSKTAPDGDTEGFGMVFLEAAAQGLAVVSYRHGGVPEAVSDGETGLLAPEGDVEALAQCLRSVLADDGRRMRMASAGHRRAVDQFDIRDCTSRLESFYDAVGRHPSTAGERSVTSRRARQQAQSE